MDIPKKYFHDRLILLLVTINIFLALLTSVVILLRFDLNNTAGFFVQYRVNLGLNAYKTGSFLEILSFMAFAIFVAAFHLIISIRVYTAKRQLAVTILGLGTILLILSMVVSNALLVLAH